MYTEYMEEKEKFIPLKKHSSCIGKSKWNIWSIVECHH